jgi:ferredoxin
VWRQTGDVRLTPHGRAKALQHGASAADLQASIASCTLCGACEPACPERIPLVDMILELREQQPMSAPAHKDRFMQSAPSRSLFLAGRTLWENPERVKRIASMLDIAIAEDDGADIADAIECGAALAPLRMSQFIGSLRKTQRLVVADGLLARKLREWLPDAHILSLGEALSALNAVRAKLRASDLYVIEPRAFHADHARLTGHYDELRSAFSLKTNLDMQHLAVPTTASSVQNRLGTAVVDAAAQARWILEGRAFERVVVEDAADCAVFASVTDRPVVHLADL